MENLKTNSFIELLKKKDKSLYKNLIILNLFYNFNDNYDDFFYIFKDFIFIQKVIVFTPYFLSLFFKPIFSKKYNIWRLSVNFLKKTFILKYNDINYNLYQNFIYTFKYEVFINKLFGGFIFKNNKFFFQDVRYYFFLENYIDESIQFNFFFKQTLLYNKYIINIYKYCNTYYYYFFYYSFFSKRLYFNILFINIYYDWILFIKCLFKQNFQNIKKKKYLTKKKKIKKKKKENIIKNFFRYNLKEKQKIYKYFNYYYKFYKIWYKYYHISLFQLQLRLKLRFKKKFRRTNLEIKNKKIFVLKLKKKKTIFCSRRKRRRTLYELNSAHWIDLIFKVKIFLILKNIYFFFSFSIYVIIFFKFSTFWLKKKNTRFVSNFFFNKFYDYTKKKTFIDLDYSYKIIINFEEEYKYLLSNHLLPSIPILTPLVSKVVNIKKYNVEYKNNIYKKISFKFLEIDVLAGLLVNKEFIYKNFIVLCNTLPLIRFLINNKYVISFFDLLSNIFLLIIIFLKLLKLRDCLNFKGISNYGNILEVISKFNINNLCINYLLEKDVFIIINKKKKLTSKLYILIEECFLYYFFFNNNKFYKKFFINNINNKLKNIKNFKNCNFIFKGALNLNFNKDILVFNLSKIFFDKIFLSHIKKFLYNCEISFLFIKNNLKLFCGLLNFNYNNVDLYINYLLKLNNISKNILYIRYLNIFLLICPLNLYLDLIFLLNNFILLYVYFFCYLYLYICKFYNIFINSTKFFNYEIIKENLYLKVRASNFSFINFLIYFDFIKFYNTKIYIKPVNYLLHLPLLKIFNYFYNILYEIKLYFKGNLLKNYSFIISKICYLTMFLKLKKKKKFFKYKFFFKVFNFNYFFISNKVNKLKILKIRKRNEKIKNIFLQENLVKK